MAKALKWIRFERTVTVAELKKHFEADAYRDGRNWGFRVDDASARTVRGRHVTRVVITDKTISPLGEHLTSTRVEFRSINFEIRDDWGALEIESPPRAVAPLLNQLNSYTDFEAVLAPMDLNLRSFLLRLKGWADVVEPTRVKTGGLSLGESVSAQIEAAGTTNLLQTLDKFLSVEDLSLRAVTATVRREKRQFSVHVTENGTCKLTGQFTPDDIALVRRDAFSTGLKPGDA